MIQTLIEFYSPLVGYYQATWLFQAAMVYVIVVAYFINLAWLYDDYEHINGIDGVRKDNPLEALYDLWLLSQWRGGYLPDDYQELYDQIIADIKQDKAIKAEYKKVVNALPKVETLSTVSGKTVKAPDKRTNQQDYTSKTSFRGLTGPTSYESSYGSRRRIV